MAPMMVPGRTDCRLTEINMSLREAAWPGHTDSVDTTSYDSHCSCLLGRSRSCVSPLEEAALCGEHSWFPCAHGPQLPNPFSVLGLWFESLCVHCAWVLLCLDAAAPWSHPQPLTLTVFLPPLWNRSPNLRGWGLTTILKYR